VALDTLSDLMHNKVILVDGSRVWTSSFNPTKAADTKNDENIAIVHDTGFIREHLDEFDKLS